MLDNYLGLTQLGKINVSPDGKKIVFSAGKPVTSGNNRDWQKQIYLADLDNQEVSELTPADKVCTSPDWSPDGTHISWIMQADGIPNIWIMDQDGKNGERVTHSEARLSAINGRLTVLSWLTLRPMS